MCGRYALGVGEEDVRVHFSIDAVIDPGLVPSWNIAPSHGVAAVMERFEHPDAATPAGRGERIRQLRCLTWGFVPHWAKTPGRAMINARAETLPDKPSFRSAGLKRRCLVPASGYYEWQDTPAGKQPWFLSAGEGDPLLAFAGIYEAWRGGPGEPWLRSVAIVTRSAPDAIGHIHDRCPLVVPTHLWTQWLDPNPLERSDLRRLIDAIPDPLLRPRPVSREVGNVASNHPGLVESIEAR